MSRELHCMSGKVLRRVGGLRHMSAGAGILNNRAQVESVLVVVGVALMAIIGWMTMAMLGNIFYDRAPTELMMMMDDGIAGESLVDMMVNNENLLAFTYSDGTAQPGVIDMEAGLSELDVEHPLYEWCIEIVDLSSSEIAGEKCSGGVEEPEEGWERLHTTVRPVVLAYKSSIGNPGELTLILYRDGGTG